MWAWGRMTAQEGALQAGSDALQGQLRAGDLSLCFIYLFFSASALEQPQGGECMAVRWDLASSTAPWSYSPVCAMGATCHPLHGTVVLCISHPDQSLALDVNHQLHYL